MVRERIENLPLGEEETREIIAPYVQREKALKGMESESNPGIVRDYNSYSRRIVS